MIDTVLFDLDGTLLPMDMERFMKAYFEAVSKSFYDVMEPKAFIKNIMLATNYMVENTEPHKTNRQAFEEEFSRLMGCDINPLMGRFIDFYSTEFKKLKDTVSPQPQPLCREIVNILLYKGYDVVLATNPLFPQIAIEERIRWSGIEVGAFKAITTFEGMHFCKPKLEYYKEIMEIINKEPKNCMMVGNDVEEDMVASELGMKTFLLEDYIISRGSELPPIDYRGSYEDLYDFVRNRLPVLKEKDR